jgi:hypothetical protein
MEKVKSTGKGVLPEVTEGLEWGQTPSDHMGYRSEEERLEKQGRIKAIPTSAAER